MINIENIQRKNFYLGFNANQEKTKINNLKSIKSDTVSFGMAYKYTITETATPRIEGNNFITEMGRITDLKYDNGVQSLLNKDLKMNPNSHLKIDPSKSTGGVTIDSLYMGHDSQISLFNNLELNVSNKATIKENCEISGGKVYFNGETKAENNFYAREIEGRGSLTIGNSPKIEKIMISGNVTIGDEARIGTIYSKKDINLGNNFTPISRDCSISSKDGNIEIGDGIKYEPISELSTTGVKGFIGSIKTPHRLTIGTQSPESPIGKIEAGSIEMNGSVDAKNVILQNDIISNKPTAILTVYEDLIVPKSFRENKSREITINKALICKDLIIHKDSGVTKLNLNNVKLVGKLVIEDPSMEVVTDQKTEIGTIQKPEF